MECTGSVVMSPLYRNSESWWIKVGLKVCTSHETMKTYYFGSVVFTHADEHYPNNSVFKFTKKPNLNLAIRKNAVARFEPTTRSER